MDVANKYKRNSVNEEDLTKRFKDGSVSRVVVSKETPDLFRYSKTLETVTITAKYGHYNRMGVSQHTLR